MIWNMLSIINTFTINPIPKRYIFECILQRHMSPFSQTNQEPLFDSKCMMVINKHLAPVLLKVLTITQQTTSICAIEKKRNTLNTIHWKIL